MSMIIIGARSFLGAAVKSFYSKAGEEIHCLSYRSGSTSFYQRLEEMINTEEVDKIICAGSCQLSKDGENELNEIVHSNIEMPSRVAIEIQKSSRQIQLITFGSFWEYLNSSYSPYNLYAASKTASTMMLNHYALSGVTVKNIILTDTYGPKDNRSKLINIVISSLKSGSKIDMTEGNQKIDLIHVDDVVSAIGKVLTLDFDPKRGVNTYVACTGNHISVKELAIKISNKLGFSPKKHFNFGGKQYHVRERIGSLLPTPNIPGWSSKIDLDKGLDQILINFWDQ